MHAMLCRSVLTTMAASSRLATRMMVGPPIVDLSGDVPRAQYEALQADLARVQAELAALRTASAANGDAAATTPDELERAFDAVDDNGDGVLTLEEFRKGYALLTGDAVAMAFESMDADGNGTLDKSEFAMGFASLTSNSARAEAERQKVEAAVTAARISAVQEAARNLAEAQLMDSLFNEQVPAWEGSKYQPVPGRSPIPAARRDPSERRRAQRQAAGGGSYAARSRPPSPPAPRRGRSSSK